MFLDLPFHSCKLLYGLSSVVLSLNRLPALLVAAARRLLASGCGACFDDLFDLAVRAIASLSQEARLHILALVGARHQLLTRHSLPGPALGTWELRLISLWSLTRASPRTLQFRSSGMLLHWLPSDASFEGGVAKCGWVVFSPEAPTVGQAVVVSPEWIAT